MQIKLWTITALTILLLAPTHASAAGETEDPTDQVYLSIIVKACRATEPLLEPTNHGIKYNDVKPLSEAERRKMYREIGCIDVPLPMHFVTGQIDAADCRGRAGYFAAMQFLEQRTDLAEYPAVGGWECILNEHPVISPVGQ